MRVTNLGANRPVSVADPATATDAFRGGEVAAEGGGRHLVGARMVREIAKIQGNGP
jgi:hypothetical protein